MKCFIINYINGYQYLKNALISLRKSILPAINSLRIIEFYGIDITSPAISNYNHDS
ncbi:hypothetical protein H8356DRAFT_1359090 [Neocallimastix lanati (nom. inval.)]|nr:hypothetical protein H8356DRAFT_1359090 [Neocallimastix sp. JGI-2020a]